MNNSFSHLVWLGAGSAAEPKNVLNLAGRATLFEAREVACLNLKKLYCQPEISVIQTLLTEHGAPVEFSEYSLAEYSAIKAVSGLKEIFPGLHKLNTKQRTSTSVAIAVGDLKLSDDNNLLVVDIPDNNLALLQALAKNHLLTQFRELHIQNGASILYSDAATTKEIIQYLEQHGFLLEHTDNQDPDLPWLRFSFDPSFQQLQEAKQSHNLLSTNLDKAQQEIAAAKQQLTEKNDELTSLNIKHNQAIAQLAKLKQQEEDTERAEQADRNQKDKERIESLTREIERLKKDYEEGERAQSLALKLQAKAQVDLEHLRTQYQQKLQQEQKLIELIQELQLKLQAAANYYHQLQLQHPELDMNSKQSNTNSTIDAEIVSTPVKPRVTDKEDN